MAVAKAKAKRNPFWYYHVKTEREEQREVVAKLKADLKEEEAQNAVLEEQMTLMAKELSFWKQKALEGMKND